MVTAARFLGVSLALTLAACSQGGGPAVETAPASSAGGIVIAQIVTHDSKVAILGGASRSESRTGSRGRDLRVVVRKSDGTMVADGITLAELRTRDPEIYMVVTSAFAVEGRDSFVDATLGTMN